MRQKSKFQISKKVMLSLFLSFSLFSCGLVGVTNLRSSDKEYIEYAKFYLEDLDYFYTQEESEYVLYLFRDGCAYCNNIKGNLFDHLDELEESGTGIACYIYNMYKDGSEAGDYNREKFKSKETDYNRDELIREMVQNQPNKTEETYFFALPSLYLIENNKFSAIYIGDVDCANYLDSH